MPRPNSPKFAQLAQQLIPQGKLLCCWPLTGGNSLPMIALQMELPDGMQCRCVVRFHHALEAAQNEYQLLETLRATSLKTA